MNVLISLAAVVVLFLVGLLGGLPVLDIVFGILLPYAALAVFLGGLVYRVLGYARVPVPFRITTTCGQEKSLPWIRQAKLDNPSSIWGVIGRMALEVLCFRSLLRNTRTRLLEGGRLAYATSLTLWLAAMAFHWSMLVILIRHLRLFTQPVPGAVQWLQDVDGFLEVGVPVIYLSTLVFLVALAYLFLRRAVNPQLRYISLLDDYLLLFLLLGIGLSGFSLRHLIKTDIVAVKELTLGLATFRGVSLATLGTISPLFFGHLFLVCALLAYFPFSKLVHMIGIFLSPTRNLANNNRMVRHVNPWDYPVKVHTYEEYEDELREKMKAAGIPVEKE
ncbi:MAG TPA: menaquinol oxidoreductase [Planctomycetaceae bacterium]|nr:menaquinol oxidoreductase [Planctomycetaceae bacterium]HIQ21228.1 menaquinol oxidoreductase [Planctomycetota bacterium]